MSLQEYSDEEIIKEIFRRMYDNNSDIIAAKIWTCDDIITEAENNFSMKISKNEAKDIANLVYVDALSDCCDSEWEAIDEAINDYIKEE